MNEETLMLRLATLIENGQRANADGYTRYIGTASHYTKQVGYTKPVGYTYAAPIGNLSTKSDTEAALEAAYRAGGGGGSTTTTNITSNHTVTSNNTSNVNVVEQTLQANDGEETQKKSILDRIKEKPVLFGLIAVFLTVITFGIYKSKKG